MGGGKAKNKKRKNNEGDPISPPPPEGSRRQGVFPTPSPTPSIMTTTEAFQQVTIEDDPAADTVLYWKRKYVQERLEWTVEKEKLEKVNVMAVQMARGGFEDMKEMEALKSGVIAELREKLAKSEKEATDLD